MTRTVLVTAGYGNQARSLIPRLVAAGFRVRAMRRTDGEGSGPHDLGAEAVVVGDAADPDDTYRALEGVDTVYHVGPTLHPQELQMGMNMIEQAQRAGVEHFVFSSVLHPILSALPQHALKRDIEERLVESGMNFTILQPSDYMQMTAMSVAADDNAYLVGFPPDNRHALVDLEDVAEAAVKVIAEGSAHYGATYELSSYDNLSANEIASSLSRTFGRPFTARSLDSDFLQLGGDDAHQRYLAEVLPSIYRWYGSHDFLGNGNILRLLLGREPTSFADFCARHFSTAPDPDPEPSS